MMDLRDHPHDRPGWGNVRLDQSALWPNVCGLAVAIVAAGWTWLSTGCAEGYLEVGMLRRDMIRSSRLNWWLLLNRGLARRRRNLGIDLRWRRRRNWFQQRRPGSGDRLLSDRRRGEGRGRFYWHRFVRDDASSCRRSGPLSELLLPRLGNSGLILAFPSRKGRRARVWPHEPMGHGLPERRACLRPLGTRAGWGNGLFRDLGSDRLILFAGERALKPIAWRRLEA